jgi:glutamine synthetase
MSIIAEYVWLDGENLRSKIKIFNYLSNSISIHNFPEWNFDGSSTGQSITKDSDLFLKPVYYCINPLLENSYPNKYYLVLCQVMNSDGSAHTTNNYDKLYQFMRNNKNIDNEIFDSWFGIEQEYIILDKNGDAYDINNIDSGDKIQYNNNQHYCSVGTGNAMGRQIAETHMNMCINAKIKICGINSEVTASQWEFQIGPLNAFDVSNQLWMARYILIRIAEKYNAVITFHPKPFIKFNGSGAHTNFSTKKMRENGGITKIYEAIEKLSKKHYEHIEVYGLYNDQRLTGKNETADINTFSYGNCDRGSSIRIPLNVLKDGCGYLEDRRPAANMDPYLVTRRILETVLI